MSAGTPKVPRQDLELASAVRSGDRTAEAELCRRLYGRLLTYFLCKARDRHLALDLTHDALIAVLTALRKGRVDDLNKPGAYALGVCRNIWNDWLRTQHRQRAALEPILPVLSQFTSELAEPLVKREQLEKCLHALDERKRTVVALTYFAEQDGPAIAIELGLSPSNVRALRHRALEQLSSCLEGNA